MALTRGYHAETRHTAGDFLSFSHASNTLRTIQYYFSDWGDTHSQDRFPAIEVQGEFKPKLESIFFKWTKIERSSFLFVLCGDHANVDTLFAALYVRYKDLRELFLGGTL